MNGDCFTQEHTVEAVFENRPVSQADVDALFEILERNDSIAYAWQYKEPKRPRYEIMDETTYVFCLTFSDGSQYSIPEVQEELETFFYDLAEQEKE